MKKRKIGNMQLFMYWYKSVQPSKLSLSVSMISAILANLTYVITPIFAARVVSCLALATPDFTGAIINLILGFLFLALRNLFWHINYWDYSHLMGIPYKRINNELLNKLFSARSSGLKKVSKEKLLSMIHQDAYTVTNFADYLCIAVSRAVMIAVTIITVFVYNVWCGLLVVAVNILNYVVLTNLNRKRQVIVKAMKDNRDKQFTQFGQIFEARENLEELGAMEQAKKNYMHYVDKYVKLQHKNTMNNSHQTNTYYVVYEFFILLITGLLVYFFSGGAIDLTVYMMLVSYVTKGVEDTTTMLTVISQLREAVVSVNRINYVKNLGDKDIKKFGEEEINDIFGFIDFKNVSYISSSKMYPSVKNLSFRIKPNEVTAICGESGSGKRTIFNMLRRKIKPQKGEVYMDGISILEYSNNVYNSNFNYITTKNYFFSGSVIKNLKMVEKSPTKIYEVCKKMGIYNRIMDYSKGFSTELKSLPNDLQYLIALARAVLTGSEVIAIYELPTYLSKEDLVYVTKIIRNMRFNNTFILFTSNKDYCELTADKVIEISKGQVKNISFVEHKFTGNETLLN